MDVHERLTRALAFERMKELSDQYMQAAYDHDAARMRDISEERKLLRDHYLKEIVK